MNTAEKILKYIVTPSTNGTLVYLDTPTHAGPTVDAAEWAAVVRLARTLDRVERRYWRADGSITDVMKEMRWHIAQRTLTDTVERRLDRRIAQFERKRRTIGVQCNVLRDRLTGFIEESRTLKPLLR